MNIDKALKQLQKTLDARAKKVGYPVLTIKNELAGIREYLDPSTVIALERQVKALSPERNMLIAPAIEDANGVMVGEYVRVRDKVQYFSFVAKETPVARRKALKKLAAIVNDLANRGFVTGFLAPFSSLKLARKGTLVNLSPKSGVRKNRTAYFVYPALTPDGVQYIQSNREKFADALCVEGSTGKEIT